MKKVICFAGFGECEVQGLRAGLQPIDGAWDCVFCADGTATLARLDCGPCAAVVANLRIRGTSSGELLQQTASRYPRTLCLALGDIADRELVANCIGGPYQFISRPCQPAELISIIERSLVLNAWICSDKLRAFVPKLGRLPTLPSTYFDVLKRTESPDAGVESVAEVIAHDPGLTARLLQMVNSAASGLAEKVTSPADAVSVLGLDAVRALVLCLQVFSPSALEDGSVISLNQLWRHSFTVAQLARKITMLQTDDLRIAADAFTAGLLHRIGQIVLATNLPKEYGAAVAGARERNRALQDEELERLGVTSDQVGAYLLGIWGMPVPFVEAVALFRSPTLTTTPEFSLLTAVHVADVLAQDEQSLFSGVPAPALDRAYLTALDLPSKISAWRKALCAGKNSASSSKKEANEIPANRRTMLAPRAPGKKSRWLTPALVCGAAITILGFAIMNRHPASARQIAAPQPAGEVRQDNSEARAIILQGIYYRAEQPVAIINGKTLAPGEAVNGVTLVSIQPSKVVVEFAGERKTLKLR